MQSAFAPKHVDNAQQIPARNGDRKLDLANETKVLPKGRRKLLASDTISGGRKMRDGGSAGMVKMAVLDEGGEDRKGGGEKSVMTDEEFLQFVKARGNEQMPEEGGGLPWEVQGVFSQLQKVSQSSA